MAACATALDSAAPASASNGAPPGSRFWVAGGLPERLSGRDVTFPSTLAQRTGYKAAKRPIATASPQPGSTQPEQRTEPGYHGC